MRSHDPRRLKICIVKGEGEDEDDDDEEEEEEDGNEDEWVWRWRCIIYEGVSSLGNIEYDNADMFGDENDSEYDDDNEEFKPDEVDSLYLA